MASCLPYLASGGTARRCNSRLSEYRDKRKYNGLLNCLNVDLLRMSYFILLFILYTSSVLSLSVATKEGRAKGKILKYITTVHHMFILV